MSSVIAFHHKMVSYNSGGTNYVDITYSGFGDVGAAILLFSNNKTIDEYVDDLEVSFAFIDPSNTGSEISNSMFHVEDGSLSTSTRSLSLAPTFITSPTTSSTVSVNTAFYLGFDSTIADGIRFVDNDGVYTAEDYYVQVIFFEAGIVADVAIGGINPNTTKTLENLGFEPSIAFFADANTIEDAVGTAMPMNDTEVSHSFGFWVNKGNKQGSLGVALEKDGVLNEMSIGDDGNAIHALSDDGLGGTDYYVEIEGDPSGFNHTSTATSTNDAMYLAIKFKSGIAFDAGVTDGPTATGDYTISGLSFAPSFGMIFNSGCIAIDTATATLEQTIYAFDNLGNESSLAYKAFPGRSGSTIASDFATVDDRYFPYDVLHYSHHGTLTGLTSDGVSINFTEAPVTAEKFLYLFIGFDSSLNEVRQPVLAAQVNFDSGQNTISFGDVPLGENWWPCIESVRFLPPKLGEFGGVGFFGECELKCIDFPSDGGGTFFGKLIASNPYYLNRIVDIYDGNYDYPNIFSLSLLQQRRYFLKRILGPDDRGSVTLQCGDALSILKEAVAPKPENSALTGSLAAGSSSLTCDDPDAHTAIDGVYYFRINDELISATTKTGSGFSGLSRGRGGSTDATHDSADELTSVYYYSGNAIDAARHVMTNFSDLDTTTYIDDVAWDLERDTYFSASVVEMWQIEPLAVHEILHKLGEQIYCSFYWDDENQLLKLKALGPSFDTPTTMDDDDEILYNAPFKIVRDQRKILTKIWYHYGKIDKTGSEEVKNYQSHLVRINAAAETGLGTSLVKEIYADYIPSSGGAIASVTTSRITDQSSEPIIVELSLDKNDAVYRVSDLVDVESDRIQDTNGARQTTRMRVLGYSPQKNNQIKYNLINTGQDISIKYGVVAPNTVGAYTAETSENQYKYGFIADDADDLMSDDSAPTSIN